MQRLAVPMVTWKTALPAVLAAVVLGIEPADASEASIAKPAPEVKPARAKPEKIVHPETTDPVAASHDPDFRIQGEYLGHGTVEGAQAKIAAHVVALSRGEFDVVVYQGGLPGDGWKRGDTRFRMSGLLENGVVTLTGASAERTLEGRISDGVLTVDEKAGAIKATLGRTQRRSPTLAATPPAGAMVLFDGGDTRNFPRGKLTSEKHLESGVTSVDLPADFTLHLEFRLSYMPTARGQYRSNSGVYLHNCYEVQVLDSFGLEGGHDECGGIYKVREPMVNMCFPPLVWQTYDIDFTAPRYDATGIKTANARVSVRHNGVPIHDNVEVPGSTPAARQKEGPPPRPLFLQGHGNHVQYRNVWLVERP